jgi:hypothetical protein
MQSILAAVVALIVAVAGAVYANLDHTQPQDNSSPGPRTSLCRVEVPGSLLCTAFETRLKALRDLLEGLKRHAEEQAIPPPQPSQTEPVEQPDGCTTEQSSGQGWSQTTVRCSQQSTSSDGLGNRIAVSSSSVNVTSTTSDDEP